MKFESHTVHSRDGTKIFYHQIGSGPGLIILHGAMQVGLSQSDLATELAHTFTCYLPDRRGRGNSGPTGPDYSILKEVEDLEALQSATGSKFIFGVSSGAVVTLKFATTLVTAAALGSRSSVERIAVFEPPWWSEAEQEENKVWLERYEEEVERGDVAEAAVTAMLGVKMGPPLLMWTYFPRSISVLMTKFLIRSEERAVEKLKKEDPGRDGDRIMTTATPERSQPLFSELVPTFRNDIKVALALCGEKNLQTLSSIFTETLILGGTRSPDYLQRSVRELEKVLLLSTNCNCKRVELEGIDHRGTFNKCLRGSPEVFARELLLFFSGSGSGSGEDVMRV